MLKLPWLGYEGISRCLWFKGIDDDDDNNDDDDDDVNVDVVVFAFQFDFNLKDVTL